MKPFRRLRVRMLELDFTQADVAELAKMRANTLSTRMTGFRPWKSDEITAVARVLEIPNAEIGAYFFDDSPQCKGGKF